MLAAVLSSIAIRQCRRRHRRALVVILELTGIPFFFVLDSVLQG
jgi:hypothetical protein